MKIEKKEDVHEKHRDQSLPTLVMHRVEGWTEYRIAIDMSTYCVLNVEQV